MQLHPLPTPGSTYFPLPSTAEREVARTSKAHFCGQLVIGNGTGRGAISGTYSRKVAIESHLELNWSVCFVDFHRDVTWFFYQELTHLEVM